MKKLNKQQKEEIIKKIQEDKPISDEYRFLIPFETEREYELTYAGKERKEDILADTLSVPFQAIKKFGAVKEGEWHNMLIFGDNLQALKHLLKLKEAGRLRNPDGTNGVKLVYIDPPFATKEEFKGIKGEKAYQDKIAGAKFIEFIRKRLIFLREMLTDDGLIWIHLDNRMDSHIRIIMDELFGPNNLLNEIIWYYPDNFQGNVNRFADNHNLILLYSKSAKHNLKRIKIPLKELIKRPTRVWDKETGKLRVERDAQGKIIYKEYTEKWLDDVWIIPQRPVVVPKASEFVDYPTQKPGELLRRVIESSTERGDIVLDCFAGSGTTGAVAEKLERKWIMCDIGKLAIYTMQKRMLNLKEEISNKGKSIKSKPFVLYNAGLYQDSGFIEKMDEADYRKFVLELFGAELSDSKVKGVQMQGILNNRPVMVFSQKDYLTHEFIDDLHKTIGSGLKDEMHIIAPQSVVRFHEDYRDKGKIRYHVLKVPYSIIQKILEKNFIRGLQPLSKANINQTIESVGFDFIYPPKAECKYYQDKQKGQLEIGKSGKVLVIEIKKFEPVQISKKPVEFEDPKKEALSMVMIDEDYDGKVFDMDHYFFGDEIIKNDFKVTFPKEKVGQKIMIIYLDVLGNEKAEVKDIKDFRKK